MALCVIYLPDKRVGWVGDGGGGVGREGCWMVVRGAKPPWKELAWRPPGPRGVLAGRPTMALSQTSVCSLLLELLAGQRVLPQQQQPLSAAAPSGWSPVRAMAVTRSATGHSVRADRGEAQPHHGARQKPKTGCLDEPEPIDLSVLHLDSLTSRTAGMSRRKQSNPGRSDTELWCVDELDGLTVCDPVAALPGQQCEMWAGSQQRRDGLRPGSKWAGRTLPVLRGRVGGGSMPGCRPRDLWFLLA
ncbi:hypothetical protein KUCAC02_013922, partial [Chaenocephalus aceratus]